MTPMIPMLFAAGLVVTAQYSDTPTSQWFKSLSSPYTRNCCDQADCMLAVAEFRNDGFWWAISNRTHEWVKIQPNQITETVSVFAKAVLCEGDPYLITEGDGPIHYDANVYCFAPPPTGF